MDPDNWDLQAVVRGCRFTGLTTATRPTTVDPFSSFPPPLLLMEEQLPGPEEEALINFPDLSGTTSRTALYELEELCKPFMLKTHIHPPPQQQQQPPPPPQHLHLLSSSTAAATLAAQQPHRPQSQIPRSKRRKNQQKKVVCQVPADGSSPDVWAWRKYGQKPIKGSPYPRGYYRCSSSKGCLARKQVERSRTDPAMLIITYTAEHNHPIPTHRSSLAGSTRHKFTPTPSAAPGSGGHGEQPHPQTDKPSPSPLSPSASAGFSPTTPLTASMEDELLLLRRWRRRQRIGEEGNTEEQGEDDEEEEEDPLTAGDMEMTGEDDMLFVDLDASAFLVAGGGGGSAERFFPTSWLLDSNAAAAAGGS